MKLAKMSATSKNWRPSILVLTGDPEDYMTMIMFALWTGNERGIVTLGRVLTGDLIELAGRREVAMEQLKRFVAQNDFAALSSVVVSSNVDEGLSALMQGHAVSPLNPNVVFVGWASNRDRFAPFARHLISIRSLKRSIVLIRDRGLPENAVSRRIDVWWRGKENGSMMLLFAHLLTLNYEWSNARIRLLRVIENEEGREPATMALEELIESARVNADPQVVVSNYPFKDVIRSHSSDATLIFLGFNVPEEKEASSFQSGYEEMLEGLPTTLLFCSSGEEDLLA